MPRRGVLKIVVGVAKQVAGGNALGLAAQLAYYFFFALFPFLLCLVAFASFFPIHGLLSRLLMTIEPFLPTSANQLLAHQLTSAFAHPRGGLLTFGLLVALWSASSGIAALISALNEAFGVAETRPFWKVRGLAMAITVAGGLALLVAVAIVVLGGQLGHWLAAQVGATALQSKIWAVARWPLTAAIVLLALAVMYKICPNVKRRFRLLSPGAVAGTILWLAATLGFTFYVNHFGKYNVMYGSLATVIVLLTWFYVSGLVLILGGQIDAVVEGHPLRKK